MNKSGIAGKHGMGWMGGKASAVGEMMIRDMLKTSEFAQYMEELNKAKASKA